MAFAARVYIQTKIAGQRDKYKHDFVIGNERVGGRPSLVPECVCEIKCFVRGFDFNNVKPRVTK
jgi:hypothetical protein